MTKRKRGQRSDASGRSVGDGKHVRLHRWMMQSAAWQSLSLGARCLMIELYNFHTGDNNGEIYLAVRDAAERLHVGKNTANSWLKELEEKGFIRPHQRGAFSLKVRHATTWILTEFSFAGQVPTKDFMTWKAPAEIQNTVPETGTYGPHSRDCKTLTVPKTGTDGPQYRDREAENQPAIGPSDRDTDSLPPGDDLEEGTASVQPASPTLSAIITDQKRSSQMAGRQQQRQQQDRPSPVILEPNQVDLEDLLKDKSSPAILPIDQLRADLKAKLQEAPKGEQARIAKLLGLSRPQISNFLAARFALNAGAAAMLRRYLDGDVA